MTTQRLHIRGNFGTQILQAAAALAHVPNTDEPILCVNHGGLDYDGTSHLEEVFNPQIRIINIDNAGKTPYWKPGIATSVFENREKIFKWLKPKVVDYPDDFKLASALHVRGGDKRICSVESFRAVLTTLPEDTRVYSDDSEFVAKVLMGTQRAASSADFLTEWLEMYNAHHLTAAPSAFIVSMLIFNPNKHLTIMGNKYFDGGYDVSQDMIFIREARQFCTNLEILDE